MRTQASRTLFWAVVLGCLLFVPAAWATDPEEEESIFYDYEGVDEDGDGEIDPPAEGQDYCVYTIGQILQGNCGRFTTGDVLCINCPATRICPNTKRFTYRDAFGTVKCRGEWSRVIVDAANPDGCVSCDGQKGYKFL